MEVVSVDKKKMLDVSMLSFGDCEEKMAFVTSAESKITKKDERPYLVFMLRDSNGRAVRANMFNLPDLQEAVRIADSSINKVCLIKFEVSEYNGLVLHLNSIEAVPEEVMDAKLFLGIEDSVETMYSELVKRIASVNESEFKVFVDYLKSKRLLGSSKFSYNSDYGFKCGSVIRYLNEFDKTVSMYLSDYESKLALLVETVISTTETFFSDTKVDKMMGDSAVKLTMIYTALLEELYSMAKDTMSESKALEFNSECSNLLMSRVNPSIPRVTRVGIITDLIKPLIVCSHGIEDRLSRISISDSTSLGDKILYKIR